MKLKKGSKAAKDFMAKIRAKKGKSKPKAKKVGAYKKPTLFKPTKKQTAAAVKRLVKQAAVKKDIPAVVSGIKNLLIFEYNRQISYGGKYYVSSNMELKGSGIKKIGTGQDHKRGLKTYLMTQTALKKMQNLFGKENTKYIQTDY